MCADSGIGLFFDILYRVMDESSYKQRDYIIKDVKADCLILGPSTANHHYNPDIISDSLGMSAYNAGKDGEGFLHQYLLFHAITKRQPPKLVILDLDRSSLYYEPKNYDRLSLMNPWYDQDTVFSSVINLRGKYEHLKMKSSIYRNNSTLHKVLEPIFPVDRPSNGYIPIDCQPHVEIKLEERKLNKELRIDTVIVSYLQRMMQECKALGIQMVVAISPSFIIWKGSDPSYDKLINICKSNNVAFIDNGQLFYEHPEYFKDCFHLCKNGAEEYTKYFCKYIKRRVLKKRPTILNKRRTKISSEVILGKPPIKY